jgi:hypothetical protein
MPALDYLDGKESETVTEAEVDRIAGYLQVIRVDGPRGLSSRKQFEKFVGKDSEKGMCEFRVGANMGHRLLCFMRDNKTFVVACGFRKPQQAETPPEHKKRALKILEEHEARNRKR